MIDREEVKRLVTSELEDSDVVLVDFQISTTNQIKILLDSFEGVPISKCVEISRLVEGSLDREEEDFELEVSSYSISEPFVLSLHYLKNIDREVQVYLKDGRSIKGALKKVELAEDEETVDLVEILNRKKVKLEGKKKKVEVEEITKVAGSEIQKTKLVPVF